MLAAAGLLSDRFRDVLALYCQTWAEYWAHHETLAAEGYVTVAGNGTKIPHPCVGMKDKCQSQLVKLQRELGLTPAAATGLLPPGTISTATGAPQGTGDPISEMTLRGRASLKPTSAA
ncbi:Phage terminase, small subunit [Planctomyces sp. SH-PL14]|nr:Phage terminase, small subunit [Planctomyces sp. SH-PL14]